MVRLFALALVLVSSMSIAAPAAAAQTITCTNKLHGLKISAYLAGVRQSKATGFNEATVKMKAAFKTAQYEAVLSRVSISATNSPGSVVVKGESRSGNLSFQLIVPENRLDKTFAKEDMAAFFERLTSDEQAEPHRIQVTCRSTVR